jgi:hypothetical protein
MGRKGDGEKGRRGDEKQGDGETGGDYEFARDVSLSPRRPFSPSLHRPVSLIEHGSATSA